MMNPYQQVKEFHAIFDPVAHHAPAPLSERTARHRSGFKAEEIVEFLYAAADNDKEIFLQAVDYLKEAIDQSVEKVLAADKEVTPLVDEVDALTDLLYFTYGSFVMLGVDPTEIFNIVHRANMGKVFPDGKPHYHPVTGKVLKPANWEQKYAPEARILNEIEKQKKRSG